MPCARARRLLLDEMTSIHRPAHFDGVADLEELGAAALRVGEQRFDAGITGSRNFVDSDVTHVKQFRDSTTAMIVRRIGRRVRLDANFLRTKRYRSATSDGKLRTGRYPHRTKPVDVDSHHAVASLAHGA